MGKAWQLWCGSLLLVTSQPMMGSNETDILEYFDLHFPETNVTVSFYAACYSVLDLLTLHHFAPE